MALQLIQGSSMEELFQKLSEYDSANSAYRISNIVQESGKFSCIVSTSNAPVEIADALGEGGALHVWVDGGRDDVPLPVTIQS